MGWIGRRPCLAIERAAAAAFGEGATDFAVYPLTFESIVLNGEVIRLGAATFGVFARVNVKIAATPRSSMNSGYAIYSNQ